MNERQIERSNTKIKYTSQYNYTSFPLDVPTSIINFLRATFFAKNELTISLSFRTRLLSFIPCRLLSSFDSIPLLSNFPSFSAETLSGLLSGGLMVGRVNKREESVVGVAPMVNEGIE